MYSPTNIEHFLKLFTVPLTLNGLNAFEFNSSGVQNRRNYFKPLLSITALFATIFTSQVVRSGLTGTDDIKTYLALVILFCFTSIISFRSVVIFLIRHKHYVNAIKLIRDIDKELLKFGIKVTYKYWFLFAAAHLLFIPTGNPIIFLTDRSLAKKCLDVFTMLYPVYTRFFTLFLWIFMVGLVLERFVYLNRFLKGFDDGGDVLVRVSELHGGLVRVVREVNVTFSLILLLNVLSNVVQLAFAILFLYHGRFKEASSFELLVLFASYTAQMAWIYYVNL